jgi:FkbM family methyltransferase
MRGVRLVRRAVRDLIPGWSLEPSRRLVEKIDPFLLISFSQEGEDLIVRRKLAGLERGFYVDVGAHHPTRFSNTMAFYRRGWGGINIDPNPGAIRLFERDRPRDINVCVGVANAGGSLTFHMFDEPAVSTFDAELADDLVRNSTYRLLERREVQLRRLAEILEEILPPNQTIDLMSIDVEGFDLSVMQSNDWERFRARCLLVEARDVDLNRLDAHPLHQFAASLDYRLFAKTVNTLIYEDAQPRQNATPHRSPSPINEIL